MAYYKRSIFLVDKNFQLKFSLIMVSLIFLSSLIFPLLFIDFLDEMAAIYPALTNSILQNRTDLILFLIPLQILFIFVVFILVIFITHKIAGPLYKLKDHLAKIREGEPITPIVFRNGDYFHDVAEEVSLFLDTVKNKQEADFQYLEEISTYIENLSPAIPEDKRPVLNEISRRLLDIRSRYKKPL